MGVTSFPAFFLKMLA